MRANLNGGADSEPWLRALLTIAGGAFAQQAAGPDSIIKRISSETERLQLTVNTSRLLTLERRIPRAQVDNPEVLDVVPRSANQIQVRGLRPGFTTLTLWDETDRVHTSTCMSWATSELAAYLVTSVPQGQVVGHAVEFAGGGGRNGRRPAQVPQIVAVTQTSSPT